MNTPQPETKTAILTHARTGLPIQHRFLRTVGGIVPEKKYLEDDGTEHVLEGGQVWEFLFESCDADPGARAQRVWGHARHEGATSPETSAIAEEK